MEVPAEVMERVYAAAEQGAPSGMDRGIIRKAVKAVAARQGENFREKQVVGLRSLGQGRTKGGEGKEYGELVSMVAIHSKQQMEATISLSTEALWSSRITSGNAGYLNPEYKDVQKCILAILQRNFTCDGFKLHLLVPQIPGTPSQHQLAKAFGEANECKLDASVAVVSTAEDDRLYYTYLQRAMQTLHVLVTPDLDVGFVTSVTWFADGITTFVANGTPMTMVTRAISRFLLQAQRQRHQELMFADEVGEEMLCFKETEPLRAGKLKLMEWNRDAQIDQQIQWARCYEAATKKTASIGEGQVRGRGRGGGQTSGYQGYKSVGFSDHIKVEGGGAYGQKSTTSAQSTMSINFNKIDKST